MNKALPTYLLPIVGIAALVATTAPGALAETRDSLCARFSGTLQGERVELEHRYTIGGGLPVTICDLERGVRYQLTLEGDGFERRIGAFSIAGSGESAVHGVQFSVVSRNAVLPGWGAVYAGRAAAGLSDDLALGASLIALYVEEMEYRHMRNRLDVQEARLDGSATYEDRERFQAAVHEAARELNVQNDHRRRLAALAGAIYAWQLLEPFLLDNPPGSVSGQGSGDITLRGARESRVKAFLFSSVRPGRGQYYQGKTTRGTLFSIAAATGGLVALHYQNEYDRATDTYEVCVERFDATDVVSEKERLRDEASRLWIDVEHRKDARNASLIVLAGVWGWNLIDTFFPAEHAGLGAQRYSFDLDERGAWIAFRF
jgi:hypothetical protein